MAGAVHLEGKCRAGEVAQWVNASKCDSLSSGNCMVEGENESFKLSSDFHM